MTELEEICKALHDEYEKIALEKGWKTQEASRVGWNSLPEANKATMMGAVEAAVMPRIKVLQQDVAFYRSCALSGEVPKPGAEPSAKVKS